jgi:hypothetical protein
VITVALAVIACVWRGEKALAFGSAAMNVTRLTQLQERFRISTEDEFRKKL